MQRSLFGWLLPAFCAFVIAGCGGGAGSTFQNVVPVGGLSMAGQGRVVLVVTWPTTTRLIPQAAASIRAGLTLGTNTVSSQLLSRPASGNTTTVAFNNVMIGNLTLSATAFPNLDGTGVAQAKGSVPVSVVAGATTNISVTMASTIDHLELNPPGPSVVIGQPTQISVTARDSGGNVVLLSSGKLNWDTVDHNTATVNASGIVTGLKPGPTQITVTDTESQKSISGTLTVYPAPLAWWKAENNALDSGTGGNNGTLSGGVTYGPGQIGQAFVFDGSNGVVNFGDPNDLKITGSLTIDCWIKVNAIPSAGQLWGDVFFRGDDRDGIDPYFLAVNADGKLYFQVAADVVNIAQIGTPAVLGVLQHITGTLDATTGDMRLYVNGQLVAETTTTVRPAHDLDPSQVGGDAIGDTSGTPNSRFHYPFNGTVDELKIYNAVVPP